MTSAVNALAATLQQLVKADAALSTRLGPQGISDRSARPQRFPALALAVIEARDLLAGEAEAVEIALTLEAWSAVSRREAEELISDVIALTRPPLAALGHGLRLVGLDWQRTASRRMVKEGLFVAEARFRAVVEQASGSSG